MSPVCQQVAETYKKSNENTPGLNNYGKNCSYEMAMTFNAGTRISVFKCQFE